MGVAHGGVRLRTLVGMAAGFGVAVGGVRGLLEVHRCRDWSHGTLWLAWSRLSHAALTDVSIGVALGLLTGLALTAWPAGRRPGLEAMLERSRRAYRHREEPPSGQVPEELRDQLRSLGYLR